MGDDLELKDGLIAPLLASYFELLLTSIGQSLVLFLILNNPYHKELLTEQKGTINFQLCLLTSPILMSSTNTILI